MKSTVWYWQMRAALRRSLDEWFAGRDFLHLETPVLVSMPGVEGHMEYFSSTWTGYQGEDKRFWLRSSPEIHLKKAVCAGVPRVYHIGKCFRSGGELSPWHHPEFTMVEWYDTDSTMHPFMDQTEELVRHSADAVIRAAGTGPVLPGEPFTRLSVAEAFQRHAGLSLKDEDGELGARAVAAGLPSVREADDFETAFYKIMLTRVEPALAGYGAVFLYDYPASLAVLARTEAGLARRFELYLQGIEISNAYEELTDPGENRRRIRVANQVREREGRIPLQPDESFFQALETGLPPCSGNALGFDRLLAVLLGERTLQPVIPFRVEF